jgi:hypothetical protein
LKRHLNVFNIGLGQIKIDTNSSISTATPLGRVKFTKLLADASVIKLAGKSEKKIKKR